MSKHTYVLQLEVPTNDDREFAYPEILVNYDYMRGFPAYTPRGEYGPIDPPEPPEVNITSASVRKADGLTLTDKECFDLACDWLDNDDNWNHLIENAEEEIYDSQ